MLEMFLYSFSVFYSPGPANAVGLNEGLNGRFLQSIKFFFGILFALLFWFLIFGYTGEAIIKPEYLPYITIPGCIYMMYIAYKILNHNVSFDNVGKQQSKLKFRDGFFMQLLNPKGMMVILPITTIQFPMSNITGGEIIIYSLLLSSFGVSATISYSLLGAIIGKKITQSNFINIFNKLMGVMLAVVSIMIFYEYVYLTFL